MICIAPCPDISSPCRVPGAESAFQAHLSQLIFMPMQTTQVDQSKTSKPSKMQCVDRLRDVFKSSGHGFTRKQLLARVSPTFSSAQVSSALSDLVANGEVTRSGASGAPQRFWPGNLSI